MPEIGDASTGIEASRRFFGMSALGVRREKAALSSGCKPHPVTAPAGSNRSSHGGNEVAEAFGERVTIYGDSASVQAVTRVNAEQALKRTTDERGWETGRCRMAQATAPILDSTSAAVRGGAASGPLLKVLRTSAPSSSLHDT
jgi:hypothetical protein